MMFRILGSAAVCALMAAPVFSQERQRSTSYSGGAIEGCYAWRVDFAYENCQRMLVDGSKSDYMQVYTLLDGTERKLTRDPRLANTEPAPVTEPEPAPETAPVTPASEPVATAPDAVVTAPTPAVIETEKVEKEERFDLPSVVAAVPGKANIIPMAITHLNRIETPFKDPAIRTSAPENAMNISFDGKYVYIAITQPVTLFIHERGHPDPAIVVSLVPRRIAPRQVKVTLPATSLRKIQSAKSETAKSAPSSNTRGVRRASPTPSTRRSVSVVDAMKVAMRGRMPRGYRTIDVSKFNIKNYCSKGGSVKFTFNQGAAFASKDFIILRAMVYANRPTKLDEQWCAKSPSTVAVSYAPRLMADRNQPVDVFIMLRREGAAIKTVRQ